MFGDVIIFTDKAKELADKVYTSLEKLSLQNKVICIGGPSGSFKTEISYLIQNRLYQEKHIRSFVFSLDDYYLTHPLYRGKHRKSLGVEASVGIQEINWNAVDAINEAFKNKGMLCCSTYHKHLEDYINIILDCTKIDTIIVEGLYSCHTNYADYSYYIDVTPEETKYFRLIRSKENEKDPFREEIVKKEYEYTLKSKEKATHIINWK